MSDSNSPHPNPFCAGLAQHELWLGSWLMAKSQITAEAMGHAGFQWLVVDMEHSPLHFAETTSLLQAIA
ncbi:MAG: aldolase/citrate lyase family protein, partial [Alphaproteobacteria bacterium]|nr:aldolase/citrate lyase family protein [Alphaproteobacteria bacterium]